MYGILIYRGAKQPITGEMFLGRSKECDLQVEDKLASRRHVRITIDDQQRVWVEDLASANGTRINGKILTAPWQLGHGDRISIGQNHLVFQRSGDNAAPTPKRSAQKPAHHRPEALMGRLIAGYRIQSIIGQGAMGTVYIAKQLNLDRMVAFKVFRGDVLESDSSFADRFLNEARLAGSINHQGLASIHECGQDEGLLWYSMELVKGETLASLIARDKGLNPALALLILQRIALALQACHEQQVIHGDIKPINIMISNDGAVKLLDMGLARILQEGRQTTEKTMVVGSPAYMSPELARNEEIDERSDLYSLGCTLVHMILSHPPYSGKDALEIIAGHLNKPIPNLCTQQSGLPEAFDDLAQGMMAKNPEWRFQNCDECLEEIAKARSALEASGQPQLADPVAACSPAQQNGGRRNRLQRTGPSPSSLPADHAAMIRLGMLGLLIIGVGMALFHFRGLWQESPRRAADQAAHNDSMRRPGNHGADAQEQPENEDERDLSPAQQVWRQTVTTVTELRREHSWLQAEYAIRQFIDQHPNDEAVAAVARNHLSQLRTEADRWYHQQVALLPPSNKHTLKDRLLRLSDLRLQVLSSNRSDIEAIYGTTLNAYARLIAAARREAIEHLESGRLDQLRDVGADLEATFSDTPTWGLYRQFSARLQEASRIPWQGNWAATRAMFDTASGEQALAAGAAMLLRGEHATAIALLLSDERLADGALGERRQKILASDTVLIDFTEPPDIQHFDASIGRVELRDDSLSSDETIVSFMCLTPIRGDQWELAIDIEVHPETQDAVQQAVISLVDRDRIVLGIALDDRYLRIKGEGPEEAFQQRSSLDRRRVTIRVLMTDGLLKLLIDDELVLHDQVLQQPINGRLRFDISGMRWNLHHLRIIGGQGR